MDEQSSPSLWAQYSAEIRSDVTFIERPWGFISYSFPLGAPNCIYAEDIYVVPDKRGTGCALALIAEVEDAGHKAGKEYFLASIKIASRTCAESLKAHLAVGFVPISTDSATIWLRRAIPRGE